MNDWLSFQAQSSPQKIALIWGAQSWTYAELDAAVSGMAAQLSVAQVKRGAHVAILMPNRPEYVFAIHALARLGAILVPLNIRLTEDELRWQADHADCTVVICSKETESQVLPLFPRQPIPGTAPSASEDTTSPSTKGHFYERRTLLSVDQPTKPAVRHLPLTEAPTATSHSFKLNALQSIVFTSGTTGYPKGAMLTFAHLFWSASASAYRLGTLPDDQWLLCMPLYHVGGMSIVFRCCLYGTAVVLMDKFDVNEVNTVFDTGRVTLASFVPTMLKRLLETRQGTCPPTLRVLLLGGAAASPALVAQAQAQGWPLALTYGLTEACSQVATSTPKDSAHKPGCVGKPMMFNELRIVRSVGRDEYLDNPPREIGEIIVRGPTIMQGYYRNQEATYAALHDGWLHTGDLGFLDEAGDLWVVDRRNDLIVTGGENVYPSEVERVLLTHAGVREACVVGLPDPEWGQKIVAVVVPAEDHPLTVQEITEFLRAHLAGYKIPREVHFVASLPQTASGKIKREDVRATFHDQSVKKE